MPPSTRDTDQLEVPAVGSRHSLILSPSMQRVPEIVRSPSRITLAIDQGQRLEASPDPSRSR